MIDEQLSREDLMREIVKLRQRNRALETLNDEYTKTLLLTFHTSPIALSLISLEGSAYVNVNDSWLRTTGYSREEVIDLIDGNFPLWLDLKEYEEKRCQIQETGRLVDYELTFQTRDGSIAYGLITSQLITLNGRELILNALTDITRSKLAERELQEKEECLSSILGILTAISDSFYAIDADWRFTYINSRVETYWQRSKEELLGKVLWDVLPQYKTAPGYEAHMRAMRERTPIYYDTYSAEHQGWFEISLYPSEDGGLCCYYKNVSERKQSEEVLRAAQQNAAQRAKELQIVIDTVPAVIWIAKDPECHFITGNRIAYDLLDIPVGANLSMSAPEAERPADFKMFQNGRELVAEEMPVQQAAGGNIIQDVEFDFLFKDGAVRTMIGNAVPIHDEAGTSTGAVAAFVDISECKKVENRLKCQNAVLGGMNRIFEHALLRSSREELARFCLEVVEKITGSQYGFISELNSDVKLENIVFSNATWEVWQTAQANRLSQLLTDAEVRGIYGWVIIDGKSLFSNNPTAHPDSIGLPAGHPSIKSYMGVPLKNNGRIIGVVALANREGGYTNELMESIETLAHAIVQVLARQQDQQNIYHLQTSDERYRSLTEKLLKVKLAQSEDRFYKVFHHNPDMIIIEKMEDNICIEANQTALDTYGYTREEIIGNTAIELGIIAPDSKMIKDVYKELKKKGEVKNYELNTRTKSGQSIDILYSSILIKFYKEECRITIMKDISDKKRYEKELARLDRLNLIGEMAASIGHEIRNPMTSVRGFLQMFNEQEEAGEKRLYYELMIEELDRANAIITEFLSMARNKTSDLQLQCLNTIVSTLLPMMQAEALLQGNEIQVLLARSPQLMLDKNEIRQMILNMLRNALDAMESGGMVTISTEANENGTLLSITDQGRGIDPEYVDKIGTPFFSSKDNGTGLGLAVCYSIAARHGAKIDFTTGPEGTTFSVHFPKVLEQINE